LCRAHLDSSAREGQLLQLEPLPHLHAAPVAGDDGRQRVAVLQGALIAVVAVVHRPHADHVAPAVTRLTEVDSNLGAGGAAGAGIQGGVEA